MRRGRACLVLGAALLLLSLGGLARAAEAPLGKTLAGDSCEWGAAPTTGAARTVPFRCGDGTGTLFVVPLAAALPDNPAARTHALAAAASGVLTDKAAPRDCDAGSRLTDHGDSLLFFCILRSTGGPRLVLVTAVGRTLYAAEGLVTMLPVLQAAIAGTASRPYSADETEAAIRMVETRYPAEVARAGGVDVASYKALIELGRLDAAARDYAGAEAAYRRVLEIETRLFGANGIAVGETLAELALQVSNQGRFDEAAGLFRRAEPIINAAPEIAARARLASYRALDAANQRHFADALKFARAATQMRRGALSTGSSRTGAQSPSAGSRGELAHSLRIEAMMALKLGDLATALADATEVLQIINDEPSLPLWWRPEAVTMMARDRRPA